MEGVREFWARSVQICLHPGEFFGELGERKPLAGDVFRDYLMYAAAVPAVAGFIAQALVGYAGIYAPLFPSLVWSVLVYAASLAYVWLSAWALEYISSSYDLRPDFNLCFAVVTYASAPGYLASALQIVPLLRPFTLLGLYSVYLLYTYVPLVLEVPPERRRSMGLAAVLVALAVWLALSLVLSLLGGP